MERDTKFSEEELRAMTNAVLKGLIDSGTVYISLEQFTGILKKYSDNVTKTLIELAVWEKIQDGELILRMDEASGEFSFKLDAGNCKGKTIQVGDDIVKL